MKIKLKKMSNILTFIPVAFLAVSCGSGFESVEKFGLSSAIIKESSEKIANDFHGSCIRKAKYNTSETFPAIIETRAEQEKECEKYLEDVELVSDANTVLIDYMVSLGKLASNDSPSFDKTLDALEASIKNLNTTVGSTTSSGIFLEEEQVNAGLKIARFIFNRLVLEFRRENLKEGILCSDDYIQVYTPGLASIVEEYKSFLATEKNKVDSYYTKYSPTPERQNQVLALFTFEQNYNQEIDEINNKKQAANAYIMILEKTAKTHLELKEEFNNEKMNDQEIKKFCEPYFAEIKSENKDRKNISSSLPSLEELERINEIVMEYQDEVEPLVKQLDNGFD